MTRMITLCGSTRFSKEFAQANKLFTLDEWIVLAPGYFKEIGPAVSEETKARLDWLHTNKIDNSGSILVINPGGYVGESTAHEISYAARHSKTILTLDYLPTELHNEVGRYRIINLPEMEQEFWEKGIFVEDPVPS